jgi:hypothetical protein
MAMPCAAPRAALQPFGERAAPLLWMADYIEGRRR